VSVTLLLSIVASIAELTLWTTAAEGYVPIALALLLHLLLVAVLAVNVFTLRRERTPVLLLAGATLFMGPFATLGGIAMALSGFIPVRMDFQSYRRALGPGGEATLLPAAIPGGRTDHALISFHDVMRWGTRSEKQAALRRMAERYSPAFSGVLKAAMRDAVPEVRSEASAAAAAILKQLEEKAAQLRMGLADAGRKTSDPALLEGWADAENAVARSGLASPERTAEARAIALAAYRDARGQRPDNQSLRLKIMRILYETGDLAAAARESHGALGAPTVNDPDGEVLSAHLEALFALGHYREIRQALLKAAPQGRGRRAAALWYGMALQTRPAPPRRGHG